MATRPPIRLPRQWPRHVKSGILHAVSLAGVVASFTRGRAIGRRRLQAKLEQAESEIALLREELIIKDGRWERVLSGIAIGIFPGQFYAVSLLVDSCRLLQEIGMMDRWPSFFSRGRSSLPPWPAGSPVSRMR